MDANGSLEVTTAIRDAARGELITAGRLDTQGWDAQLVATLQESGPRDGRIAFSAGFYLRGQTPLWKRSAMKRFWLFRRDFPGFPAVAKAMADEQLGESDQCFR